MEELSRSEQEHNEEASINNTSHEELESEETAAEQDVEAYGQSEYAGPEEEMSVHPSISLETVEKRTRRLFQILCGAILLELIRYFLFDILRWAMHSLPLPQFFAKLYWNENFYNAIYFCAYASKILFAVVAYQWILKVYNAYDFLPMYREVYGKAFPYVKGILPPIFTQYLEDGPGRWIVKLTNSRLTQERVNALIESPVTTYSLLNLCALAYFFVMDCLPYLMVYTVGELYFELSWYMTVGWILVFLHLTVWFIILWPIIHTFRPLTEEEIEGERQTEEELEMEEELELHGELMDELKVEEVNAVGKNNTTAGS